MYRAILRKFLEYLAAGNVEAFWVLETSNVSGLKTKYQELGSISAFIDWLEKKALQEESGNSPGSVLLSVGGLW